MALNTFELMQQAMTRAEINLIQQYMEENQSALETVTYIGICIIFRRILLKMPLGTLIIITLVMATIIHIM